MTIVICMAFLAGILSGCRPHADVSSDRLQVAMDGLIQVGENGRIEVSKAIGRNRISVFAQTKIIPAGQAIERWPSETDRFLTCMEPEVPCRVINSMSILVNDKKISFDRSLVADLGGVNGMSLHWMNGSNILSIVGGDASSTYVTEIAFDEARVTERRLYGGFEPSQALEVTKYFEIDLDEYL